MTAGSTPAAASEPGGRECASFTESSGIVPDFPWADACEAKVRTRPLVVIGGGYLSGKHPHPVGLSLAGLRPLVLIGGILPPGSVELADGANHFSPVVPIGEAEVIGERSRSL